MKNPSEIILVSIALFLCFVLVGYAVCIIFAYQLLFENIEAQNELEFQFWYRLMIEQGFRENELEMILGQLYHLKKQCKFLVEALNFFINEEYFDWYVIN